MERNKEPKVSVIIACYNAEKYIDRCLESLLNQTYENFEIVICDDCSTDHSYDLLLLWQKKDQRIKVIRNNINSYAAATRNECFKKAAGDYYMIQDIDDASTPNRIERLLCGFINNNVDFVSSSVKLFENNPDEIVGTMKMKKEYPTKNDLLWSVPFFHPATMFSAQCIKSVGGYRVAKETRRMEDYDLFMRLYSNGFKGRNIQEELYLYRKDADQMKRSLGFRSVIEEIKVRKNGYKQLKVLWYAWPFLFKPFLGYFKRLCIYNLSLLFK